MADVPLVGITNGVPTSGTGTVMTISQLVALIGEVQASPTANTLLDRVKALAVLLGEVQASPTANTLLDRLKVIATALALNHTDEVQLHTDIGTTLAGLLAAATPAGTNIIGKFGIDQTTPGTTNGIVAAGTAAANAAASGNPVRIGIKFNTSLPTNDDGDVIELQGDANGRPLFNLGVGLNQSDDTVGAIPTAAATGGATPHHKVLANSNNSTSLKASAGQIYSITVVNYSLVACLYLKLFDKASAPTPGSDTIYRVITVPAAVSAILPSIVEKSWPTGLAFPTGVAYATVTGLADADNTSVAASSGTLEIDYK